MSLPFELRIALRYLMARRKQAFISVISGISILGVAVGVMAVLIALGLMTGLQGEVRSRILGATAHVSVFNSRSEPLEDYRKVVAAVRRVPRVLGSAPALYGKGVISGPTGSNGLATVKGLVPDDERTVTELATQVEDGKLDVLGPTTAEGMAPILLGRDLANALGVGVGDVVTVMSPQGRLSPMGILPRLARYRVAGT
ncbi:MAG: ABC transporter permease, partial [Vicinamibacteria bacterium]